LGLRIRFYQARNVCLGRVGAPPLTHLRGNAAIVSSRNAALQLKNGSCEDDEPSQFFESRRRAKEGSMVVPTVKDTRVAASSMIEGKPCG
jgi:hypothetical protein